MNEKKLNASKYLWEMWDIAGANDMDVGVGRDMFWANLNNYGKEGAPHYAGADQLDYAALSEAWKAMPQEEQWEQKILCGFISRKYYGALVKARKAGDREKWERIAADAVADFYAGKAEEEAEKEVGDIGE